MLFVVYVVLSFCLLFVLRYVLYFNFCFFFFFKQKTAYEMRISDWSSDVCSSDLVIRAIDSLQLTDSRSIATPVNWEVGAPVVISPKLSDEEASRLFPQGYKTLKPYLRIVDLGEKQPG